jgi:hypothetical protein
VSLLAGATPGIHHAHSEFYIRHVRIADTSPLVQACRDAGYPVHEDPYAPNTFVVGFPVHEREFDRPKRQVSIWEQFSNVAALQRYWADNQVSVTITFTEQERDDIIRCLEIHEADLKSVSLMPLGDDHGYEFPPYQEITQEDYERLTKNLRPINMEESRHEITDKFCSSDKCELFSPSTDSEDSE